MINDVADDNDDDYDDDDGDDDDGGDDEQMPINNMHESTDNEQCMPTAVQEPMASTLVAALLTMGRPRGDSQGERRTHTLLLSQCLLCRAVPADADVVDASGVMAKHHHHHHHR